MLALIDKLEKKENTVAALLSLIAFGVYRWTVCPTVSFTDSGELATVATTLGIAHPTGYPVWTLIGRIAVMLPWGAEEIVRLNALAGVLTALSVGFLFKLVLVLYRSAGILRSGTGKRRPVPGLLVVLCAGSTALVVGFSSTVWAQSVEIEVYALHLLLVIAATCYFVSGIVEISQDPERISRSLFLFSFVLGLSFANHMTTILLAPGFLYLYFVALGSTKRSWKIILALSPFFILGLSAYGYLLIRSAGGPVMDWGHPVSLQRLWWHMTGKQYQTWMFAGWDVAKTQLGYFVTNFPHEFQWILVALLAYGVVEMFRQSRRLAIFLLLLFGTCLAYSINYDINEIDPYFLLSYLACGALLAMGIKSLAGWCWNSGNRVLRGSAVVGLFFLPLLQVLSNRTDVDQSKNYQAEDFVKNVFSELEPNAVVFTSLWDYFVSPSYYYQLVAHERPDVILIDRDLLQNRTWYFIQFERRHPGILEKSGNQVNAFLGELNKFEQGEPFNYLTIRSRWDALLHDLTEKLIADHPVYVDPRIAGEFPQDFEGVPQGLLIRLVHKGQTAVWKPMRAKFTQGTFQNYVTSDLKRYYASIYTFHALWLLGQGAKVEARTMVDEGLRIDPTFLPALRLRAQLPGQ